MYKSGKVHPIFGDLERDDSAIEFQGDDGLRVPSPTTRKHGFLVGEETDERYQFGTDDTVSVGFNPTTIRVEDPKQKQEDEDDEAVHFVGLEDDAQEMMGFKDLGSVGQGGFISPELEERVKKMAELLGQYKQRAKKLREMHGMKVQENLELTQKLQKLEDDKEESEMRAGREMRMLQYKNMGGTSNNGSSDARRKREEAKKNMYKDQGDEGDMGIDFNEQSSEHGPLRKYMNKINHMIDKHRPLKTDLKKIEARFGSSVASYFRFFSWMVVNYYFLAVSMLIFLIRHVYSLIVFQALTSLQVSEKYNTAGEPFSYYNWSSERWSQWYLLLPRFLMFSSFNPGDTSTIYITENLDPLTAMRFPNGSVVGIIEYADLDVDLGERVDYISMILVFNIFLVFASVVKWAREDRRAKSFEMLENLDNQTKYAQVSLCCWDHNAIQRQDVEDLKHSLLDNLFLLIHESETANLKKERTTKQNLALLARRLTSNLFYLAIQASSAMLIIYLTATSAQMSSDILQYVNANQSLSWLKGLVTLISGSIVPIAVSAINAMLPALITLLTQFEKWDDTGFHTKLMIFRLFLAKNVNAIIQIFSFVQLLDPYLLLGDPYVSVTFDRNARANTAKRFTFQQLGYIYSSDVMPNGLDECRADSYGAGVFQLVITEFVISKTSFYVVPLVKWLLSKLRKKKFVKSEFDVAKQMVNLLYFQQLCFMSFPFNPFGTIFIALFMYSGFKLEARVLTAFMVKPKKPWSAKDAANFFIKFFFISYVISGLVTYFICSNQKLGKACTLEEHLIESQFGSTNPVGECYNTNSVGDESIFCPLESRTIGEIQQGSKKETGLEELKFWEEYFLYTEPNSSAILDTETLLRERMGYTNRESTSFPTLLVCSLSCGPFLFEKNYISVIDRYFAYHLKTIYSLSTGSPLFVWMIVVIVSLRYKLQRNTISVMQKIESEKDGHMQTLLATLESKTRKLKNKLDKLKNVNS